MMGMATKQDVVNLKRLATNVSMATTPTFRRERVSDLVSYIEAL